MYYLLGATAILVGLAWVFAGIMVFIGWKMDKNARREVE